MTDDRARREASTRAAGEAPPRVPLWVKVLVVAFVTFALMFGLLHVGGRGFEHSHDAAALGQGATPP